MTRPILSWPRSNRRLAESDDETVESWAARNWNCAELAGEELVRHGLPRGQLLVASAPLACRFQIFPDIST